MAELRDGPLSRGSHRHGAISTTRLSDGNVALIVKRRAEMAGLDPADVSGHSLRVGLVTSTAAAGVSERVIAQTAGHQSMTVLSWYIRTGSLFTENAAAGGIFSFGNASFLGSMGGDEPQQAHRGNGR